MSSQFALSAGRRFKLHKRGQLFIRTHNETLSVAAMRVSNRDLISDVLPFGRLWYDQAPDAIDYAKFFSRSHDAVIRVCEPMVL